MVVKKLPVSFNEDEQRQISKIADYLGIGIVWGADAKAIKFSIALTLSALENPEKVYRGLEPDKMTNYFQAIKNIEVKRKTLQIAKESQENLKNGLKR